MERKPDHVKSKYPVILLPRVSPRLIFILATLLDLSATAVCTAAA